MVALVVSSVAALLLGLTTWLPQIFEQDIGVASTEPALLTVAGQAKGVVPLGGGVVVALHDSGFSFADDAGVLGETVTAGAPVTVLLGTVETDGVHPRERVRGALDTVRIDDVDVRPGSATYRGTVSGKVDGAARTLPLLVRVMLRGDVLLVHIEVPGADAVVVHLDARPAVIGMPPVLPDRNLRRRAWWLPRSAPATDAFRWILPSTVGIGASGRERALDLRPDGRIAVHVWSSTATLSLSRTAPPA